jgi:hypothetical protein
VLEAEVARVNARAPREPAAKELVRGNTRAEAQAARQVRVNGRAALVNAQAVHGNVRAAHGSVRVVPHGNVQAAHGNVRVAHGNVRVAHGSVRALVNAPAAGQPKGVVPAVANLILIVSGYAFEVRTPVSFW